MLVVAAAERYFAYRRLAGFGVADAAQTFSFHCLASVADHRVY